MNSTFTLIGIVIAYIYLTACTVHAYIDDWSRWKQPFRYRMEKRNAWAEARKYGRVYRY